MLKFTHTKNPILKGQHLIGNGDFFIRLTEADFESDEQMNQAISFILSKLNS